jgi:hypothetical protein
VGVLVFAANVATWLRPWHANYIWPVANIGGVAGTVVISALLQIRTRVRAADHRVVAAYVLFYAFGYFCADLLGHFGPRELGAFWPIYFMLFYMLAGLWFGRAFVAIGLAITVLTLIGYFYVLGGAFLLWMAMVNGCGLVLGGLWMRWN